MRQFTNWAACWYLAFSASVCWAQGLLVATESNTPVRLPRPRQVAPNSPTYRIQQLEVDVRLRERVAQVQVSQTFQNTSSRDLETCFVFPLPYDGAIDRMTLLIDGREVPARLLPAEEANQIYQETVRRNRDPALLEWLGVGMFKTSVFPVPAGATRTVTLRYTQICRQDAGLVEFLFPLSTAKYTAGPLEKLRIDVHLEAGQPIKNIYSPSHQLEIERTDEEHAVCSLHATDIVPANDLRLIYDVGEQAVGTTLMSYRPDADEDGYLMMLTSPSIEAADTPIQPKTVVFVVDRSGSMSGTKIEQAKTALKFVLERLRKGDLFNIVAYDAEIEAFAPELQTFNDETRARATAFVDGLVAGGSTNIDAALRTALKQLKDPQRPSYLFFLTDGLPTAGEQNESRIVAASEKTNQVRARMFTFGVGYDVNSRLLDKLARANHGRSQFVRPNEDLEVPIARLYQRIETPVLTQVTVEFQVAGSENDDPPAVYRLYPKGDFDLFQGEQIVLAGRYRRPGEVKIVLTGQIGGETKTFEFDAELAEKSADDRWSFVEKIWATRRVGEIIDQIDLNGRNEELIRELVELSTRHGILTPYTSFLADENTSINDVAANTAAAGSNLKALEQVAGQGGFVQRRSKMELQYAATASQAPTVRGLDDQPLSAETVRVVGPKTFYLRGNGWVDASLSDEEQANAQTVTQFSDSFFTLAAQHGRLVAQYLAFDEAVTVKFGGQVWHIVPADH